MECCGDWVGEVGQFRQLSVPCRLDVLIRRWGARAMQKSHARFAQDATSLKKEWLSAPPLEHRQHDLFAGTAGLFSISEAIYSLSAQRSRDSFAFLDRELSASKITVA